MRRRLRWQGLNGFVNWLTTHLSNVLGAAAVARTRARGVGHAGFDLCRLDIAKSSVPVWARTTNAERVFYVRLNNSSREMPDDELSRYLADRSPNTEAPATA